MKGINFDSNEPGLHNALEDYQTAIELAPNFSEAYNNAGNCLRKQFVSAPR